MKEIGKGCCCGGSCYVERHLVCGDDVAIGGHEDKSFGEILDGSMNHFIWA